MKKLFCILLSLTLCFAPINNQSTITNVTNVTNVFATSQENTYTITGVGVNSPTKEQIAGFYQNYNISAALNSNDSYSIDPLTYATPYSTGGQISTTTQTHALNVLNYIRYIAGISYNITIDPTYTQKTQDACFLNYLNKTLTHYPTRPSNVTDALFESGYSGAGSSNLSATNYSAKISSVIIDGWVEDGDSSNIATLGHRRCLLNPVMTKTGFGSIDGYYTGMYAHDTSGSNNTVGVAWPAQNTPMNTFSSTHPWSYSANRVLNGYVEVTLTQLNKSNSWTFNSSSNGSVSSGNYFNVNNEAYGQKGCIIFDPNISISSGDVFFVEITENGSVIASYPVTFFNINDVTANTSISPSATGTAFTYTNGSVNNTTKTVTTIEEVIEVEPVVDDIVEEVEPEPVVEEVVEKEVEPEPVVDEVVEKEVEPEPVVDEVVEEEIEPEPVVEEVDEEVEPELEEIEEQEIVESEEVQDYNDEFTTYDELKGLYKNSYGNTPVPNTMELLLKPLF